MMRISELTSLGLDIRDLAPTPAINPLAEVDALREAQVTDIYFDAKAGVVAVILELRQALQLDEGSTAVLLARGVRSLGWSGPARGTQLTAWSIGSSVPRVSDGLFSLSLGMWPQPGAQLSLAAERAAFVVCDVHGLPDLPPDYTSRAASGVVSEVATWHSEFEPISVAVVDATSD